MNTKPFALRACILGLALAAAFAAHDVRAQTGAGDPTFTVTKFDVTGDNPLSDAQTQTILNPYLGPQTGLGGLESAQHALEAALKAGGFTLYRVVLPPQDTAGVIRFNVVRFPITSVSVTGAKYFDEANVRASVPGLKAGEVPNLKDVSRQLELANESPDKKTTLHLKENDAGTGIDATLETKDQNPLSFTAGFNNSGSADTGGRARLVGYAQDTNLFDRDQTLGLSYTTSPIHPDMVKEYGAFYKAPIYSLGGAITASYSYSSVDSGALGSGQEITGRGTTDGVAYTQYFYPIGDYKSSLAVGLDDKLFRAPEIGGVILPSGDVRSRPYSVIYVGSFQPVGLALNFNVEYAKNLDSGGSNTDAAYAANRVGASPHWEAYRAGYTLNAPLYEGWSLSAALHGQYSPDALISGEQFGLGGEGSVRGAPERAVTGDTGLSTSLEVWTPELASNLRALVFSDSGFITRYQPQPGETARDGLQSAGLGLRWAWQQTASLSLDYGRILRGSHYPAVATGTSRVEANLLYRF